MYVFYLMPFKMGDRWGLWWHVVVVKHERKLERERDLNETKDRIMYNIVQ